MSDINILSYINLYLRKSLICMESRMIRKYPVRFGKGFNISLKVVLFNLLLCLYTLLFIHFFFLLLINYSNKANGMGKSDTLLCGAKCMGKSSTPC